MTPVKLMAASALALAAACGVASAQMLPEGRIYAFHSRAQAGCPELDWHLVVGANNALTGMISWDNMKSVAHAWGTANPANRSFTMEAVKEGGSGNGAAIDGTIRPDGWLVANIKGQNVNCQGIVVQWFVPVLGSDSSGG